jgi:hypothetical protein
MTFIPVGDGPYRRGDGRAKRPPCALFFGYLYGDAWPEAPCPRAFFVLPDEERVGDDEALRYHPILQ